MQYVIIKYLLHVVILRKKRVGVIRVSVGKYGLDANISKILQKSACTETCYFAWSVAFSGM